MSSEFIRLTSHESPVVLQYRKSKISCVASMDGAPGTIIFTSEQDAGTHVNESPEEVMAMLEENSDVEASSPFNHGEPYPEFTEPYQETVEYWQKRSQYWKLRAFRREDQIAVLLKTTG